VQNVRVPRLGCALLVLVLAGALVVLPPATAGAPTPPALDPQAMPWLPEEGLAIQEAHGVRLVGLDGHVFGRLAGFTLATGGGGELLGALASSVPEATLLQGPRGRGWLLAGGRLTPITANRLSLRGGARLDARYVTTGYGSPDNPVAKTFVRDARSGTLLARGTDWGIVDGRLLVTSRVVLDLITRQRWTLPSGIRWSYIAATPNTCTPAGIHLGRIDAVCAVSIKPRAHSGYNSLVRFFAVSSDRRRELLGRPFLYANFGAAAAYLSPDATHIAATLAVGCGPPYAIVGSTHGGAPLYVTGQPDSALAKGQVVKAEILGWSENGQAIAEIAAGECESGQPPGIYLVDPESFARTLVLTLARSDVGYTLWQSNAASAVG
jgi:hypothetical protein